MAESRWQDMFLFLKNKGYNVYSPGSKSGECTKEYLVLKSEGATRHGSFSTIDDYYDILCYVPEKQYKDLEVLVERVRKDMKELEPLIMPDYQHMPSFYDDSIKAHMTSMTYLNHKKMYKRQEI